MLTLLVLSVALHTTTLTKIAREAHAASLGLVASTTRVADVLNA